MKDRPKAGPSLVLLDIILLFPAGQKGFTNLAANGSAHHGCNSQAKGKSCGKNPPGMVCTLRKVFHINPSIIILS